jgi:hypothetical protein
MVNVQTQISAQANFIADTLLEWAQANGGDCQVVHTKEDEWMQPSQSSQKPIIYVFCDGEDRWSSNDNISALTHRVSRNWIIRVKRGRGFTRIRGDTISKTVGNAIPFTDAVEHIRDMCRAMLGISEDAGNDYKGWKYVRLGTQVMDCADLFFSTKNDLPNIVMTPDE